MSAVFPCLVLGARWALVEVRGDIFHLCGLAMEDSVVYVFLMFVPIVVMVCFPFSGSLAWVAWLEVGFINAGITAFFLGGGSMMSNFSCVVGTCSCVGVALVGPWMGVLSNVGTKMGKVSS